MPWSIGLAVALGAGVGIVSGVYPRAGRRGSTRSPRCGRNSRVGRGTRITGLFEGVAIALDALRTNKVRASLTILGIAVGVFVVVAMAAAIHGINDSVAHDIESAGATTFFVQRYPVGFNTCDGTDETCPWRHNPPLRLGEAAVLGRLPSLAGVTVEIDFAGSFKYADRFCRRRRSRGYTPGWTEHRRRGHQSGTVLHHAGERERRARRASINDKMVERLFRGADPIGQAWSPSTTAPTR